MRRSLLAAVSLILLAAPAMAQETGTPVFLGPDRLFQKSAFGVSMSDPGSGIAIEGKEAVIGGRSNIVGKPLALMLLNRHATVTVCHTRTRNLAAVTRRADILVAAAGKAEMIRGDMVREGAVVIDVGINRRPRRKAGWRCGLCRGGREGILDHAPSRAASIASREAG